MPMASNAMSRTENQDRTCLVQILLSHTFLPDHFVKRSIKLFFLLFFSKTNGVCKPLQVILHQFGKIAHFDVDFTAVGVVLVSAGFLAPQSAFPTFLPLKHTQMRRKSANSGGPFSKTKERLQPAGLEKSFLCQSQNFSDRAGRQFSGRIFFQLGRNRAPNSKL